MKGTTTGNSSGGWLLIKRTRGSALRYRVARILDWCDDKVIGHRWYPLCRFTCWVWPDEYAEDVE